MIKHYGAKTTTYVGRVCLGRRKTYKGFCWKYITEPKQTVMSTKDELLANIFNNFSKNEIQNIIISLLDYIKQ